MNIVREHLQKRTDQYENQERAIKDQILAMETDLRNKQTELVQVQEAKRQFLALLLILPDTHS